MRRCSYCWKLRRGAVPSLLKLSLFQFYWLQTTNMKNRIMSLGLVGLVHQGRLKRLTEGHLDRIESSRATAFRLSWVLGVTGRRSRTGFVAMRTSFVWYGKVSKDTHNYMVITLPFFLLPLLRQASTSMECNPRLEIFYLIKAKEFQEQLICGFNLNINFLYPSHSCRWLLVNDAGALFPPNWPAM